VRLVLGRRLERLSEDAQRILTTSTVIGCSFGTAGGLEKAWPDAALKATEEANRAHLVETETPGRQNRYRFVRELLRQTLSQRLSLLRRQRLHARVADSAQKMLPRARALASLFKSKFEDFRKPYSLLKSEEAGGPSTERGSDRQRRGAESESKMRAEQDVRNRVRLVSSAYIDAAESRRLMPSVMRTPPPRSPWCGPPPPGTLPWFGRANRSPMEKEGRMTATKGLPIVGHPHDRLRSK
jgi:hypothetical protein